MPEKTTSIIDTPNILVRVTNRNRKKLEACEKFVAHDQGLDILDVRNADVFNEAIDRMYDTLPKRFK